jgi:DNA repair and recombination protein RAD52
MNWDLAKIELQKPLSSDAIKPPPQGKHGEYVDGLHVIREANRIFGENGWSYRITRLELVSRIITDKPQVRVGYMATVELNVDGVIREGSAVGSGMVAPDNEADAHESAIKEAETDAMKRALRSFGNTFGLALYEKDASKRQVERPKTTQEKVNEAQTVDDINGLIAEVKALNKPAASQHLHERATALHLHYDKDVSKYTVME